MLIRDWEMLRADYRGLRLMPAESRHGWRRVYATIRRRDRGPYPTWPKANARWRHIRREICRPRRTLSRINHLPLDSGAVAPRRILWAAVRVQSPRRAPTPPAACQGASAAGEPRHRFGQPGRKADAAVQFVDDRAGPRFLELLEMLPEL